MSAQRPELISRHVHELHLDAHAHVSLTVQEYAGVQFSALLTVTTRRWDEGRLIEEGRPVQVTRAEAASLRDLFDRALYLSDGIASHRR